MLDKPWRSCWQDRKRKVEAGANVTATADPHGYCWVQFGPHQETLPMNDKSTYMNEMSPYSYVPSRVNLALFLRNNEIPNPKIVLRLSFAVTFIDSGNCRATQMFQVGSKFL